MSKQFLVFSACPSLKYPELFLSAVSYDRVPFYLVSFYDPFNLHGLLWFSHTPSDIQLSTFTVLEICFY